MKSRFDPVYLHFESESSPLQHRKTGIIKHRWKMWRFEAQYKKVKRARDREIARLTRR